MIYHKKNLNFAAEGVFNNTGQIRHAVKTLYDELQNRLCQNFIRSVLTEEILCEFVVGK